MLSTLQARNFAPQEVLKMKESTSERSELLRKRIDQSPFHLSQIAELTEVSRSTYYRYFRGELDVPASVFFKVGKVIKHDFSLDIPELKPELEFLAREDTPEYGNPQDALLKCQRDKDKLQLRCIDLQEELNKYMKLYYEAQLELAGRPRK